MALTPDRQPTYTILRGCPASGKTTWADSQPKPKLILNRDDARRELFKFGQWSEYKFSKEKEDRVTKHLNSLVSKNKGVDVIDSNTNLNTKYLMKTIEYAEGLGFKVVFKDFFNVPLHILIERNINREYSVPELVIHDMYRKQVEIQGRVITHIEGLLECVVVDVDGTIADMGKGESWGRMPYDWTKVLNDKPKKNVISLVRSLWLDGNRIIFMTGRDGVCLEDTKEWINTHVFKGLGVTNAFNSNLAEIFIRTHEDMRPDPEIKEELLRKHVLPRYNIKLAIEDRARMVDLYQALGIECWQVAAGRF